MEICRRHGLILIEDCAHTMGATWDGRLSGSFGAVGCFSAQTFKHINSGEGGLLATDDEDIAAKAILTSGSYMLYAQHRARPSLEVFERHRTMTPNCSMRMSGLVAAILRPQIALIDQRAATWRKIYGCLAPMLDAIDHIRLPTRPAKEGFVPSSLQFSLQGLTRDEIREFIRISDQHGVHVKWFGNEQPVGFTSRHSHWHYLPAQQDLGRADQVLDGLCDFRLPIWLDQGDCATITAVLAQAMVEVTAGR